MERDAYPAQQALDDIAVGNRAIADRLVTPRWYHPVLGLGYAGFILGLGLLPKPWNLLVVPLFLILCGLLVRAYRSLTGIWVRPAMSHPSGRLWMAYSVITCVCLIPALLSVSRLVQVPVWLLVTAAAIGLVATLILGPRLDQLMRAELRAGIAKPRFRR